MCATVDQAASKYPQLLSPSVRTIDDDDMCSDKLKCLKSDGSVGTRNTKKYESKGGKTTTVNTWSCCKAGPKLPPWHIIHVSAPRLSQAATVAEGLCPPCG